MALVSFWVTQFSMKAPQVCHGGIQFQHAQTGKPLL